MAKKRKLRHGQPIVFENEHVRVIEQRDGSVFIEEATPGPQSGAGIMFGKQWSFGGGLTFTTTTHSNIRPVVMAGSLAWHVSH